MPTARAALDDGPTRLERLGMVPTELEAIVRVTGRPPLLVRNGEVQGLSALTGDFPPDVDGRIVAVQKFLPSVGRIEFVNHDMDWGGTGWVIAEDGPDHYLIVTNRHVAQIVARRTWRGDGVFMFSRFGAHRYGAAIDFGEEEGVAPDPATLLPVERFTYIADDISADVALARVPRPADEHAPVAPLPLADTDGEDGEMVATVGYPAADGFRNNLEDMERYFRGLYDVKRFAPGFLKVDAGASVLSHDCTTLGGNSGSPLISLDRARVVGLHFAGRYGVGNSAVRSSTLRRLLDGGAAAKPGAALPAVDAESRDGTHDAGHFAGRAGYDPDFLRVAPVPLPVIPDGALPRLSRPLDLARPADATEARPHELRYQHFGVLYALAMKQPVLAALNIDGERAIPIKRGRDRWFKDLRIDEAAQLDREDYGDPEIDRGHMVRRAATNWGTDAAEARLADADSFHYTNAAPQHLGLNRSRAKWLGLEDYILTNARTFGFRACVFTGPVFTDADPQLGQTGAPLPMHFWKVVAMLAEAEDEVIRLHATAYLLSQGQLIQVMLAARGETEALEGFAFGAFKTFQVRIADLAEMTGYDFGPLVQADPLARAEETVGLRRLVEVDDYAQLVL
jgi:endonuclease G